MPGSRGGRRAGGLRPGGGGERQGGEESDDCSATEHGLQRSRSRPLGKGRDAKWRTGRAIRVGTVSTFSTSWMSCAGLPSIRTMSACLPSVQAGRGSAPESACN